MNYIKRDVIILIILLAVAFGGCLSDNTDVSVNKNIIDENYFSSNLNNIFVFLNSGNLEKAEESVKILSNIDLPEEYEPIFNLAYGILELKKHKYDLALSKFYKALPLTEGYIGILACKLNIGTPDSIKESEKLFQKIPANFQSKLYYDFNNLYVRALYAYYLFWTADDDSYFDIIKEVEFKNLNKENELITEIINKIEKTTENFPKDFTEDL
jgi:hypothetical protein